MSPRATLFLAFLLLPGSLSGCQPGHYTPATLASEVMPETQTPTMELGQGYNAALGQFARTTCVSGTKTLIQRPSADLKTGFGQRQSASETGLKLIGEATGDLVVLKISGKVTIETKVAESDLKTIVYSTFTYKAGNTVLSAPALTLSSADLSGMDHNRRLRDCGDEYVYQEELGGRLFVGMEYVFATKELKMLFDAKISVSDALGIVNVTMALPGVDVAFGHIASKVNLVFLQEGGDQAAYQAVLSGLPQDCVFASKVVDGQTTGQKDAVLSGFQPCVKQFNETLLPYARDNFRRQIEGAVANRGEGLEVLRYYTKRYSSSGFYDLQETMAPFTSEVQATLARGKALAGRYQRLANVGFALGGLFAGGDGVSLAAFGSDADDAKRKGLHDNAQAMKAAFDLHLPVIGAKIDGCRAGLTDALFLSKEATDQARQECATGLTAADAEINDVLTQLPDQKLAARLRQDEESF